MSFILTQVTGAIALILVCISYFLHSKNNFLIFQVFANIFYALSFVFTGSLVAGIGTFISIFRVLLFYILERKNQNIPFFLIIIFSAVYIINGIIFFKSYLDIIPICTSILFTVAMWMKNIQFVRYFMILPNVLIAIYALLCQAYVTACLDFIEAIVVIIAIIKYHLEQKKNSVDNLNN